MIPLSFQGAHGANRALGAPVSPLCRGAAGPHGPGRAVASGIAELGPGPGCHLRGHARRGWASTPAVSHISRRSREGLQRWKAGKERPASFPGSPAFLGLQGAGREGRAGSGGQLLCNLAPS